MSKYEEIRSMCFSSRFLCGSELYKLLEADYVKNLVSRIKDGTVKTKSYMSFGTHEITKTDLFLYNFDRLIYYIRDRIFINPTELRMYLEYMVETKYMDKILFTKQIFDDDSYKFEVYFWQIATDRMLSVLKLMYLLKPIKERLDDLGFNPKKYNIKKKDDARTVFNFFSGMMNCRQNNLFNLFIDNKTIEPERIDFYTIMWCHVLDEYKKKERIL